MAGHPTRSAATKHSPKRKERPTKKPWDDARWDEFLRVYAASGPDAAYKAVMTPCDKEDIEEEIAEAHRDIWRYANAMGFKTSRVAQWTAAKAEFRKSLDPLLDSLTGKSIKTQEKVLDSKNPKHLALQADVAHKHLKGIGIYGERHEVTGADGAPLQCNIIVQSPAGADMLKRVIAGERTEKEQPAGHNDST